MCRVGYTGYGDSDVFIETLTDGSWVVADIGTGSPGSLSAVSCTGPDSCVAIGSVAAVYSSGTWSVGNYADSSSIDLSGISCTAGAA